MTVETDHKIIIEDLVNALDNICELYEKQADLQEFQQCIVEARTLLNSISESSYIDTVLTDIQKCSIL